MQRLVNGEGGKDSTAPGSPWRQTVGLLCLGLQISVFLSFGTCKRDPVNLSLRAVALGTMMRVVLADLVQANGNLNSFEDWGQLGGDLCK